MQFGFGVFPYTRFRDIDEIAAVARLGETLGYHALLLPEHLLPPHWPQAELATKYWFDVCTLAGYLAAVTTRLRLLTSVIVVPYHHPVALAKALATLDVVSHGRVLAGVGAGWMQAEFRRLGIDFSRRGAITDEYLRAIKELWASDAPRFSGERIAFADVSFFPKPVQRPAISLLIGGTGPRPWRRVAELGDGWLPMTATPAEIARGAAAIRALLAQCGRDPAHLWIGYSGVSIGADPEVQQMRRHAGDNEAKPALRGRDEIITTIERYRAAGVSFLSISFAWRTAAELMAELQRFAEDVMPVFR